MDERRFVEVSASPWHVGGTSMPNSDDPRENVWSKTPPGMQSGNIVARDCRPADARLIAAAPDLLAAAKAMLASRDAKASLDAVAALRNAITKAEGRRAQGIVELSDEIERQLERFP